MRVWAEQELVIPDGPYAGRAYRIERQPVMGHWFDAIDSGNWSRHVATGPTQSGKTLSCSVAPTLYHLFETVETVIFGLPTMDMARDKWEIDLRPAIEASRYRDLLPRHKETGGRVAGTRTLITFSNGAHLRFMTAGGRDKSRAAFTSRVLVVTEVDDFDEHGEASREADKLTQLEQRLRAYKPHQRREYLECTVSIEQGRTWQEYINGTRSIVWLECYHCGNYVSMERDSLHGWIEADSKMQAQEQGHFVCSACNAAWSEADRMYANRYGRLVSGKQQVVDGELVGDAPNTDTFSFRWTASHNMFLPAGGIAADEYRAARSKNSDNAEREMRQFVWALPIEPDEWIETPLDAHTVSRRVEKLPRGAVPDDTLFLTVGLDIGKWSSHYVCIAHRECLQRLVIDYAVLDVPTKEEGVDRAIITSLRQFYDRVMEEGLWILKDGTAILPGRVLIDARYKPRSVYQFCHEVGDRFMPSMGYGVSEERPRHYTEKKSTGAVVKHKGDNYHISWFGPDRMHVVEFNSDYWKTELHDGLALDRDKPGAISLFYSPNPREHLTIGKHWTNEKTIIEYVEGKGAVKRWVNEGRKPNHYLDATAMALCAGHLCGFRTAEDSEPEPAGAPAIVQTDEMPYLITER